MDDYTYLKACRKLATENGIPFSIFNSEGFRMLARPIEAALKETTSVTTTNEIGSLLSGTVTQIHESIRSSINNKLICLKLDTATRCNRTVITVSLQHLSGMDFQTQFLGAIKMMAAKDLTVEHVSNELQHILDDYNILDSQIYMLTHDNGVNYRMGSKHLQATMTGHLITTNVRLDNEIYKRVDDLLIGSKATVRSVGQTFHVAVKDAIKTCTGQLQLVRSAVTKLRRSTFHTKIPNLKVPSSSLWTASFDVIKCLLKHKTIIVGLDDPPNISISVELWTFMTEFIETFSPVHKVVQELARSSLLIGDLFKMWLECEIDAGSQQSALATSLSVALNNRKRELFAVNEFVAAIYMDPRFNFAGSDVLSATDIDRAKVIISEFRILILADSFSHLKINYLFF